MGGVGAAARAGFAQASAGSPATASPGPCGGPLRGARQAAWSMQAGTERAVRSGCCLPSTIQNAWLCVPRGRPGSGGVFLSEAFFT